MDVSWRWGRFWKPTQLVHSLSLLEQNTEIDEMLRQQLAALTHQMKDETSVDAICFVL